MTSPPPGSSASASMPTLPEGGTIPIPKWLMIALVGALISVGGGIASGAWAYNNQANKRSEDDRVAAAKMQTTLEQLKANQVAIQRKLETQTADRFTASDGKDLKQELVIDLAVARSGVVEQGRRLDALAQAMGKLEAMEQRVERLERRLDERK